MLPRVKILFANGALGQVVASADGVFGILTTGAPVVGTFELLKTYTLKSLAGLTALGITEVNNPGIYKLISQYYAEAGDGAEVWLKAYAETESMTVMISGKTGMLGANDFIQSANGRLKGLFVHRTPGTDYDPDGDGGIDPDVLTALAAAQLTAQWSTDTLKAPIFIIISGLMYLGNPNVLTAINTMTNNRCGVMIGDTKVGGGCAIGLLAGRLARIPIQRNIGRVRDGSILSVTDAYLKSTRVESADPEALHDKGYITFRTHIGRSGYFFSDDPLATLPTDDYCHLTARRTIDKAYRIGYDAILNYLLDEIPVTDEGKVTITFAKSLETVVENAIINNMTANGELGNDPTNQSDTGVECWINTDQNIVSTGNLKVTLKVKPYGYGRFIDVELGFKTIITS